MTFAAAAPLVERATRRNGSRLTDRSGMLRMMIEMLHGVVEVLQESMLRRIKVSVACILNR